MTSNINQDDKKKKKKLLIFLILFILLDIILLVVLLVGRTTLSPDYAPVNEEKYAEDIGDDEADKGRRRSKPYLLHQCGYKP